MAEGSFAPTDRSRLKRLPDRGSHERADVHRILDATYTGSIGYVIDGKPYVTTTAHWRDGDRVYWHGSSASRFLRSVVGTDACLTAHLVDGFVLARSGFEHSMNYRSVTVFGRAELVEDRKAEILDRFVEKLVPGRSGELRRPTEQELKATTVLSMVIEEASVKVRDDGTHDPEADWDEPVWAGVLAIESRFTELVSETEPAPLGEPSVALRALLGRRI